MSEIVQPNLQSKKTTNFDDENGTCFDTTSITSCRTSILQMGFPSESEEIIREMIEKERQHSPRDDYLKRLRNGDLDLNVRNQSLDWIWKACEELQFGPLCMCLAINYLDRFLSVHDLPSGKSWTVRLLAVACLSLAAKIEEIKVPELIHLQVGDPWFMFEPKTVQRMELLVLNVLGWRLRAVTPCSYIRYLLSKINGYGYDQEPSSRLILRSLQVIATTTKGIDFLEFRASEIAAAVALSVSGELHTLHSGKFSFYSFFSHLEKERVKKIGEMIERDWSPSCSETPNYAVLQFKTHHHSHSLSTTSVSSSLTSLS
ncbi:unnamed protein product [Microthlaspi erraticum]|uniref:Uncharacterized protein n=1 Tax=Microthlaspi erraticum TaxID=1685480 RepID=A0A6D2IQ17_9BRAS|nr:unnamed protein product [Microthlaspi erraticum]